jgi:pimeloyl-ACP methyl ester carboxylesterase
MASSRSTGCAIAIAVVLALVLVLLRLVVARSLIYPGSPVAFPPDLESRVPGARLLRYYSADGAPLEGAFLRSADPAGPVAVCFHGNAESAAQGLSWSGALVRNGIDVFLPEVRGYGGLSGRPTEKHFYEDGEAALDALRAEGIPPERTVLLGRSLGSGIAVELALRRPCKQLILVSPYTSMVDMGRLVVGALAPLVIPDRYDSLSKIGRVRMPIVILHGTRDEVIPIRMGRALAAAAPEARYIEVPDARHNEFPGLEEKLVEVIQPAPGAVSR